MGSTSNEHKEGSEPETYVFQHTSNATTRLNYQHYLWQDTFQFWLHPELPEIKSDARIADVATGSGVWLLELSRRVPSTTHLFGFDVSLDQIGPQASTTISNLQFRQWNFFEPPPTELRGTFDVVHMRLVAVTVKNNDPERILQNVKLLLKPGGYLQWEEHYTADARVYNHGKLATTADNFPGTSRLRDLMALPLNATNGQKLLGPRDWIAGLPLTTLNQGFAEARNIVYSDNADMGMFWTDVYIDSVEEFAQRILTLDPTLAH